MSFAYLFDLNSLRHGPNGGACNLSWFRECSHYERGGCLVLEVSETPHAPPDFRLLSEIDGVLAHSQEIFGVLRSHGRNYRLRRTLQSAKP